MVDYGSSDGKNSLVWVAHVVKHIRGKNPQNLDPRPLHFVFVDVANNDWNYFWRKVAPSFLSGEKKNIFFSTVGRSYFEQIQPNESVSMGVSAAAFHWMSSIPTPCKDTLTCHLSTDPKERSIWKVCASQDWNHNLRLRSRELKKGGKLVVSSIWLKEGSVFQNRGFALMNEAWRALVKEGLLSQATFDSMTLPVYIRTLDEYRSYDSSIPLSIYSLDTYSDESPFFTKYKEDGDLEAFGEQYMLFMKAVNDPILKDLLNHAVDKPRDVDDLLIKFWSLLKQKVMDEPESVSVLEQIVIVFEKK